MQIQYAPNQEMLEMWENPVDCAAARSRVSEEDVALLEWHHAAMDVYNVKPRSLERIGWFASEGDVTPGMAMVSRLGFGGGMDMLVHTIQNGRFGTAFTSPDPTFYSFDSQGNPVDFDTFLPFQEYDSIIGSLAGKSALDNLYQTSIKTRVVTGNLLLGDKPSFHYQAVIGFFVGEVLSSSVGDLEKSITNMINFVEPGGFFSAAYVEAGKHRTPGGIIIDLAPAGRDVLYNIYDRLVYEGVIDSFMINVIPASGQLRPEWDPCPYSNVIHVAGRKH